MSLLEQVKLIPRARHVDERGWFLKVIHGNEDGLPAATGEVYLVSADPGKVRGNHYHPVAAEWFTVVSGEATLILADPTSGERSSIQLSSSTPVTAFIPPGLAHAFLNSPDASEPMVLVAYSDRRYDPADTVAMALV